MKTITSSDFVNLFKNNNFKEDEEYIVGTKVEIKKENYPDDATIVPNVTFEEDVNFKGDTLKQIVTFENCIFHKELSISNTKEGSLILKDLKIDKLKFTGINLQANIIIIKSTIRNFKFTDFTNLGVLRFSNITSVDPDLGDKDNPELLFSVINSDLGETSFSEFNFSSFSKIIVNNGVFSNIKCSNVTWFKDVDLLVKGQGGDSFKIHRRKREIYRQIKHSLVSSGNYIDSLEIKALEMAAQKNQLKYSKNYKCKDRIVMWANLLNDFGQNWLKPTVLLFLINMGFYLIMTPIFNEDAVSCAHCTNMDFYWKLFNPARRVDDIFKSSPFKGCLYFLDSFQRVILGVFIFQIITAFRRFSKKQSQ